RLIEHDVTGEGDLLGGRHEGLEALDEEEDVRGYALRRLRREPGSGCGDYSPGIPHNRQSGAGYVVEAASVAARLGAAVSGLESGRDGLGHHARDVSAELGDLLAQRRGDIAMLERGHQEDRD